MESEKSQTGPAVVINARRTESLDAPHILNLVHTQTEELFGRVNIVNIIEKAVLAVTLCNANDEILAHAAFFDYPNLNVVDQAEWESWLVNAYGNYKCSPLNSLFLHYFVAQQEYGQGCAKEIMRTAFNAVPELHFIFLVVPVGIFPEPSLASVFSPLEVVGKHKGPSNNIAMFVCNRHDHVPVLHIRPSRVEDHDDLTPLFNQQNEMLRKTYGDYYLAELIEAQNEHMRCFVAEIEGSAVGFMSVVDDVNFDLLNECFELGTLHGLRKPHPSDVTTPDPTPIASPLPIKIEIHEEKTSTASTSMGKTSTEVTVDKMSTEASKDKHHPDEGKGTAEKTGRSDMVSDSRQSNGSKNDSTQGDVKVMKKLSDLHLGESSQSLFSASSDVHDMIEQELADDISSQIVSRESSIESVAPVQPFVSKRFIPQYHGEPNAFSIQLFCIEERSEMRSTDFLPMAFSQFPDRDFCIISIPHLVPEFPLLQNFLRVIPRSPSTLPQELYVFHRSGLIKKFKVRPACTKDFEDVKKLVCKIQLNENLLADLNQFNKARRDPDGTEIQAFVAECQKQIVGVAIIRREEDIEFIRSHYNIEDFIYYNHHRREDHGHLHHLALNPVFYHLTKHFLKEILRLSHKTCLYYPLYPAYTPKEILSRHSLVCSLGALVAVRSRRQIRYPVDKLGINAPSHRVLAECASYALNHISCKLVLEPKVTINTRIVVIGASDAGLAFLETIAYCPHLRFNNLTLISPHGLPGDMAPDALRDQMLPSSRCYTHEEHAKVSLRTWVNIVYGKMTAILRKEKCVLVNENFRVPYDHLIIATGKQFQVPKPTGADIDAGANNDNLPSSPEHRLLTQPPRNLFVVNDSYQAAVALYKVENSLMKGDKPIIVYGANINAYCCIQSLMTLGVKASSITLVEPPTEMPPIDDPVVLEAVQKAMTDAGVTIHSGYYLARWNDSLDIPEKITSATFTSADIPLKLSCQAFFAFYSKGVDMNTYSSLNNSYIVYDGALVIDGSFHTTDVSIRGVGPVTKFKRSYHADQLTHACFNSKEVGIALATEMLRLFDPTLEPQPAPTAEPLNLVPLYRSPRITEAKLPGGYHYLEVIKPGIPDLPEYNTMQTVPCREISTGTPESDEGYMKLVISPYQAVEKITCLTKKEIPTSNFICLYGVHQRFLNNLLPRYDEGLIKDFYSFFQESWCMAIYHDRFSDFRDEIRELLLTAPDEDKPSLEVMVRKMVDEEVSMTESQRKALLNMYRQTGSKEAVEMRLLSFLSYNYYHLPMYAKPGMV